MKAIFRKPVMLLSTFLLTSLFATSAYALSVETDWIRQFGGPGSELAQDVDANGNIYIVGRISGTYPGQTSAGGTDVLLLKYDSDGNEVWARQFGTAGIDTGIGVVTDGTDVYIVGYTEGTLSGETSSGGRDAYIRKYDTDGNILWTEQYGTDGYDEAISVVVVASRVFVVGHTSGEFAGQTNEGSLDVYYRVFDPSGTTMLTNQFGTDENDYGNGIAVDNGNIYVSGGTEGELPGQTTAEDTDAFVIKFDLAGNTQWISQFGTEGSDSANRIILDETGIYTAGLVEDALPGTDVEDAGDFIRKYDTDGKVQWTHQCGGEEAFSVFTHSDRVYITGSVFGALPGQTSAGGADAYVCAYDINGNNKWITQFGTSALDTVFGVKSSTAVVYLVGTTGGALPGQTNSGGEDIFIMKLTQDKDLDGIFSEVDADPTTASTIFTDGVTTGEILTKGDMTIVVKDSSDLSLGVSIEVEEVLGVSPAEIEMCDGKMNPSLDNSDKIDVTCGSAIILVSAGDVEVEFIGDDGTVSTTSVGADNEVTFDPETLTFSTPETNTETIVVTVGGEETPIEPGETVVVEPADEDEDDDGVLDEFDMCPATVLPDEVPTVSLKPNHFADVDGDGTFEEGTNGTNSSFTLEDTSGCSCAQMVDSLPGMKKGLQKYGCPQGIMEEWVETY